MALIDVSELLTDPDFCDPFQVVRTTQSVDQSGTSVRGQTTYDVYGSVQPGGGDQLQLLPDAARVSGNLTIYTQFQLQAATDTTEADVVLWQDRSYRVMVVSQFDNWGLGYTQATCQLVELLLPDPGYPST